MRFPARALHRYADVVVHRQLLAALAGAPSAPMPHAELAEAALTMNARHRDAKRASKTCEELYLLLLVHTNPHVERAVVCEVSQGTPGSGSGIGSAGWIEVFVPRFHVKARVVMTCGAGGGGGGGSGGLPSARLPFRCVEEEERDEARDPFLEAERRSLR